MRISTLNIETEWQYELSKDILNTPNSKFTTAHKQRHYTNVSPTPWLFWEEGADVHRLHFLQPRNFVVFESLYLIQYSV